MVALAHRPASSGVSTCSLRTTSVSLRPGRRDAAAQIRTVGDHRIADQLLLQAGRADRARCGAARTSVRGRRDAQLARPATPMVQPWISSDSMHHDEGDVEIEVRAGQSDQHRDRGEEHADRAAQADPGDEQLLAQAGSGTARGRGTPRPAARPASAPAPRRAPAAAAAAAAPARPAGRAARTWRSARARWRRRGTSRWMLWARVSRLPTIRPAT